MEWNISNGNEKKNVAVSLNGKRFKLGIRT